MSYTTWNPTDELSIYSPQDLKWGNYFQNTLFLELLGMNEKIIGSSFETTKTFLSEIQANDEQLCTETKKVFTGFMFIVILSYINWGCC